MILISEWDLKIALFKHSFGYYKYKDDVTMAVVGKLTQEINGDRDYI